LETRVHIVQKRYLSVVNVEVKVSVWIILGVEIHLYILKAAVIKVAGIDCGLFFSVCLQSNYDVAFFFDCDVVLTVQTIFGVAGSCRYS